MQDLLTGRYTSKSRNKLIAKAFKEVGLIERYGSGIIRIHKICNDYGIIEPIFKEVLQGLMVILYKAKSGGTEQKVTDKVTDNQKAILENMIQNNLWKLKKIQE